MSWSTKRSEALSQYFTETFSYDCARVTVDATVVPSASCANAEALQWNICRESEAKEIAKNTHHRLEVGQNILRLQLVHNEDLFLQHELSFTRAGLCLYYFPKTFRKIIRQGNMCAFKPKNMRCQEFVVLE